MAKVDLHVHSCYSEHPSEWFLQRIGTRESYVDPEDVYKKAKSEGMSYITLTDHNVIEGAVRLKMRHPDDVFIGVEVTTYFPEDGAKIHVLVWGLSEAQFRIIDKISAGVFTISDLFARRTSGAFGGPCNVLNQRGPRCRPCRTAFSDVR